jgi:sugar phosphate isomerase/epimerase
MAFRTRGRRVKLDAPSGAHLTYCTNIHPGESWEEVRNALRTHVVGVKQRLRPTAPFGVGLRLAARAASDLAENARALEEARSELDDAGLYVFTLNGFPFGAFHGSRVKERVYRPDWLEADRVSYTQSLGRVLAVLLPDAMPGSISTVPGCFRERNEPGAARAIAHNVAKSAAELVRIERETGKTIALALEPEPACLLETTDDALGFFEGELLSREVVDAFAGTIGADARGAEATLRRHVGVCLDACHASVEFERPVMALQKLRSAGIGVPKIQLSAGLRISPATAQTLDELRAFDDGVYFHQTVVRGGGELDGASRHLRRFVDLPAAFEAARQIGEDAEWRVHFHVPVFHAELGRFSSTQEDLRELLVLSTELSSHLEVETYTFDVLPAAFRDTPVTEAVARELEWVLETLALRRPSA